MVARGVFENEEDGRLREGRKAARGGCGQEDGILKASATIELNGHSFSGLLTLVRALIGEGLGAGRIRRDATNSAATEQIQFKSAGTVDEYERLILVPVFHLVRFLSVDCKSSMKDMKFRSGSETGFWIWRENITV